MIELVAQLRQAVLDIGRRVRRAHDPVLEGQGLEPERLEQGIARAGHRSLSFASFLAEVRAAGRPAPQDRGIPISYWFARPHAPASPPVQRARWQVSETERERRTERRGRRQAAATVAQRPWRRIAAPFPPTAAVRRGPAEAIHEASLTILEGGGDGHPAARGPRGLPGGRGRRGGQRVRFDRGLVLEAVAKGPGNSRSTPATRPGTSASAATRSPSAPSPALPTAPTSRAAAGPAARTTSATSCA